MPKSFRELREQSIRLGSGKKYSSRHTATHRREPHISHALKTGPTGEFDRPKKQIQEILTALAVGAAGAYLGYKAHGAKKRVNQAQAQKASLRRQIQQLDTRKKQLQDRLKKTSYVKAALNIPEEFSASPKRRQQLTALQGNIKHQQLYGKHPYFGTKRNQQDRIMDKIKKRLNKEEAGPVSVAGGAVPSITDPTTNYAAQLKKNSNMLRRKKPK
jgi:hypothetical protein